MRKAKEDLHHVTLLVPGSVMGEPKCHTEKINKKQTKQKTLNKTENEIKYVGND